MADPDIFVRPARATDYDGLCQVIAEVDALHREALPHIFRAADAPVRDRADVLSWIADEDIGLFVAEAAGEVIGFVQVVVRESPPVPIFVPRRYAVVDSLAVKAAFRGSGGGRALMAWAEKWASSRGAGAIELHVWEFNRDAIAFYERLGYATASRRMRKSLAPVELAGGQFVGDCSGGKMLY